MGRVYLETSFLSACVSVRADARSVFRREESRRWWVQQRGLHQLFISPEVIRELSEPTHPNRDDALTLTAEAQPLALTDEARGLARILVKEKVMPGPEGSGDAMHVAIAVVYGMEVVLSWSVRHLANRNKMRHLREVCRRVGYVAPEILTPDAFWETNAEDDT